MHYDFNKAMAMNAGSKMLTKDILAYKRILVVDDSITTRTMIKNIMLNASYAVDIVESADAAFVKLKTEHYDLIITDLQMPNISGFEFVSKLKNDEMYADIPIIVMSSLPEGEAMKNLSKYNIEYYICKESFNQEEFSAQIENILTKYHNY
jgi:two-component system chemotaxis sensor kinase CheA